MIIIRTVKELQDAINQAKLQKRTVGFVPTMGALHQGHIALIQQSCKENEINVVSIFVNPTQFNDKNDLDKYPRTLEADVKLIDDKASVDFVFAPSVEEIYPEEDTRIFNFGLLDKVMEGKHRPGHFNGVAQVVSRLFDIVKPTSAYFGEKDFQQLAIIRAMVKQLNMPIEIKGMPIVREHSGLAMSSRNSRLSESRKEEAKLIYKTLTNSKKQFLSKSVTDIIQSVISEINSHSGFEVEYFEIVDGNTLMSVNNWSETDYAVGCITVFCDEIRLIDNITYFLK